MAGRPYRQGMAGIRGLDRILPVALIDLNIRDIDLNLSGKQLVPENLPFVESQQSSDESWIINFEPRSGPANAEKTWLLEAMSRSQWNIQRRAILVNVCSGKSSRKTQASKSSHLMSH